MNTNFLNYKWKKNFDYIYDRLYGKHFLKSARETMFGDRYFKIQS